MMNGKLQSLGTQTARLNSAVKTILFLSMAVILSLHSEAGSNPKPGDVFRRITFVPDGGQIPVCMPNGTTGDFCRDRYIFHHDLGDLSQVKRIELSVEYWGGHIGTSQQDVRINDNNWIPLPQPKHTPTDPHCYFRTLLGNPMIDIPLHQFKPGVNEFEFRAGPQVCYDFNNGFYWIYSYTLFIYYDDAKPHPTGHIMRPKPGAAIGDNPEIAAFVQPDNSSIRSVDFFGYYQDFDFEGNGEYRQWHYQVRKGEFERHLGHGLGA